MSSVLAKNHKPTGLEFWDTAVDIEAEIYRIIRKFPKSARFTHSIPLYDLACKLNDNIVYANSMYCTSDHEVELRKDAIQKAIGYNEAIIQRIRRCLLELDGIDANCFDEVGKLLIKESQLLRAWKSSAKQLK